jgi:hypothetical protein
MIDLIDIVENLYIDDSHDSCLLCESFKDPRLYQVWKSLQKYKINFNDIFFVGVRVAWDKIDNNDIEEIDNINTKDFDNMLKAARRVKAGKDERPFIIFAMKNEELKYIYNPCAGDIAVVNYISYSKKYKFHWYGSTGGYKITQKEQFQYLQSCDYLIKVYLDTKDTHELLKSRRDAKSGMWNDLTDADRTSKHLEKGVLGKNAGGRSNFFDPNTFYGQCDKMVQQAIEKWKEIIAENKFKRDQDTSEVDNAVQDIMTRLPKATANATKNPEKYDRVGIALEELMKAVYDKYSSYQRGSHYTVTGSDEILVLYQRYCQTVISLKKGTSYDVNRDVQNKDIYKNKILAKCKKVDELLKKFDA